jgi:glycosyltransferase involved in cell wall biosynthesis
MAAGRPVILAIDGVIRAVVEDAQAGIFVTPGDAAEMADAIRTLAADPALGRKMGLAGRQYIETKFNRSDIAAEFGQLLDEVMRHE